MEMSVLTRSPFGWGTAFLFVCGVLLIVSGFVSATRVASQQPEGKSLVRRLYLGTEFPWKIAKRAAYLIVYGMICAFIGAVLFILLSVEVL